MRTSVDPEAFLLALGGCVCSAVVCRVRFCFPTVLCSGGEASKGPGRAAHSHLNLKRRVINVWPPSVNQPQEPSLPYLGREVAFSTNPPHDQMDLAQIKCLLIL